MDLDFQSFFEFCDPSRTLRLEVADEKKYYIDFASVRQGNLIETLQRTIVFLSASGKPTCQLFTGHIGCGKSTELLRLKDELQKKGFHVVYFESTQNLDMADIDITDILLAIVQQVSSSLETIGIKLRPPYFIKLFRDIADFLQTPVEFSEAECSLPGELFKITTRAQNSPKFRSRVRQYLEPRTNGILDSINNEVLANANNELAKQNKKGLVVIIDNLDRVDPRTTATGRTQPEYLFIDRGEQLRKLNCHLVYTVPLALVFSNDFSMLQNRLGGGLSPQVLPMIPVKSRDGSQLQAGMALLKQMVLARAFPDIHPVQRIDLISKLFDTQESLERLCEISGGHVRNLLGILYSCLRKENPPISRACLEREIREYRDNLLLAITDDEWELLFKVIEYKTVNGEAAYQILLRSMFVFEYRDDEGQWFDINPALAETERVRAFLSSAVL